MTVAVNDTIERYAITGAGPYPYTWRIFNDTDLQVYALSSATPPVPTLLTYLTHYTVTGANVSSGGSITLTAAAIAAYTGYTLDIRANTPRNQPTSIRNQARFLPEIHEDAFDYLDRQIQDMGRRVDASVQSPDNELALSMVLPPVATRASKFLVCDINGQMTVSSGTGSDAGLRADLANGAADLGTNLVAVPRTTTEKLAASAPTNYLRVPTPMDPRRYGADDTGVADSSTAINNSFAALNAGAIKGGALKLVGDNNTNYLINATVTMPQRGVATANETDSYAFSGSERMGPRLKAGAALSNAAMVNASNADLTTLRYYAQFKDLYFDGNNNAQGGIDLRFNQHFRIDSVFITRLKNGAGTGYGIKLYGAICSEFRGLKVHNCEGDGINAYTDSGNFFNANLIAGCSMLAVTNDGAHFAGHAGGAIVGTTFEFCGNYGLRFAGYSGTCGFVGGNYLESNAVGEIYIGDETTANALVFEGNYLNGYSAGVSAANYTPVRIKFADGTVLRGLMVNNTTKSPTGFLFLDANIAGGSVQNCVIEDCQVRSLADNTAPNTIANLPTSWVDFNNRISHPKFFPLITSNLIRRGWPSAGWTTTVSGTGTAVVSGQNNRPVMGGSSIRLVRPAASTSSVAQTFALETGSPYKGRFVTLAVPVRDNAGSSQVNIQVTPNGTSPQTANYTISSLVVNQERIVYVLVYVPSDATQIAVNFTANATGADFDLGMPCLYVGAAQWYNSYAEGDTFGTWTPVIGGSTSTTGQTYTRQTGYWSRNGHLVTCSFDVLLSAKGTITGNVVITGLPFVGVAAATTGLQAMSIGYFLSMATNWVSLGGYVEGENSRCFLTGLTAAAAGVTFPVAADISNTTELAGSFTYAVNKP